MSESVCVRERVNSSEKSFVSVSEPFDRVPANEYVHAMVRVQVIVYVNDVDMSRVFVFMIDFSCDPVFVSVSSSDRVSICVLSELNVFVSPTVYEQRVQEGVTMTVSVLVYRAHAG